LYCTTLRGAYHIAPSIDDIADATGITSKSTVRNILLRLEAAGKIGRWEGKSRGIYLK
jgi:SOS-response transcriptional repressor LexA